MGRKPAELKPLNNEQRELISQFMGKFPNVIGLIRSTRRKLYNKAKFIGMNDEEMTSIGLTHLAQETPKFDKNKAEFGTFAVFVIASAISHQIEMMSRKCRTPESGGIILDSVLANKLEHGYPGSFFDVMIFGQKNYQKSIQQSTLDYSQNKETISNLMGKLDPRSRNIVKMRFGIDCKQMTLREVGTVLGLTKGRIRQIENKALAKMKFESHR